MDFMDQEQERGITIQSAAITFGWKDKHINLIDTPGHLDFTIEVERSLRVLDSAVIVVDAGHGVEAQTEKVWSQANKYGIPRIVFVNKMDRDDSSFPKCLEDVQKLRESGIVVPLQVPVYDKDRKFTGYADVITGRDISEDKSIMKQLEVSRNYLFESLSEVDDDFLEEYLEKGNDIAEKCVMKTLARNVASRKITPVVCGSGLKNIGVTALLDYISVLMPPPAKGNDKFSSAFVFKVKNDARKGNIAFSRIYDGKLKTRDVLKIMNTDEKRRVDKIFGIKAENLIEIDSIESGNIAALILSGKVESGQTLVSNNFKSKESFKEAFQIPPPSVSRSIEPSSLNELPKLMKALEILHMEDPSFHYKNNEETGQILISGMGELHLEIMANRLKSEFGMKSKTGPLMISYRETLKKGVTIVNERKFDNGIMKIILKELDTEKLNLSNDIQLNNLKVQLKNSEKDAFRLRVQDLLLKCLTSGPLLSSPLLNIAVGVDIAFDKEQNDAFIFKELTSMLFQCINSVKDKNSRTEFVQTMVGFEANEIVEKSVFQLLEPLMRVKISSPSKYFGSVLHELTNNRRSTIHQATDMDLAVENLNLISKQRDFLQDCFQHNPVSEEDGDSKKSLVADLYLSETLNLDKTIRSLTQGYGQLLSSFEGYSPLPKDAAKKTIASIRGF
ncbi:hypothetical protein MP638_004397 [Amoeboaphelidium occidentale]|nr:hypothetical protein MP638_004397 [Amoeboaphelidium occidentale]